MDYTISFSLVFTLVSGGFPDIEVVTIATRPIVRIGLSEFTNVTGLGKTLLTSAGIAGVVIGVAAQPTLGNIIAGMQVAITQPVRIGDTISKSSKPMSFGIKRLNPSYSLSQLMKIRLNYGAL